MNRGKYFLCLIGVTIFLIPQAGLTQTKPSVSENTEACLACHAMLHPGIGPSRAAM